MPEPRECRKCGEQLWSCGEDPICEGCEMHARGYDAGRRGALTEASVADLVAELGRRTEGALPTEAEVARLVAGQEERLRALEAHMHGLFDLVQRASTALDAFTVGIRLDASIVERWQRDADPILGRGDAR